MTVFRVCFKLRKLNLQISEYRTTFHYIEKICIQHTEENSIFLRTNARTDVDLLLQNFCGVFFFPRAHVHAVSILKLFLARVWCFPAACLLYATYVHHRYRASYDPDLARRKFVRKADAYGKSKQRRDARRRYSCDYIVVHSHAQCA